MRRLPSISEAELEVLKTLWARGPSTVREVWDSLPEDKWVYTTVQTLLQRLEVKRCVKSRKPDRLRVYEAALTRDDLVRVRLRDLSRDLCDGSALPLVHGLVTGTKLTQEDVRELRAMLDEVETGNLSARRAQRRRD